MGAEATNRKAIRAAIKRRWITATQLHEADTFLDRKRAPNTILDEMFGIDFLTNATSRRRERASTTMRPEDLITIESWYRILPDVADLIRDKASDDEEEGRASLMVALPSPLNRLRLRFIRSIPMLHPLGEWYIRTSEYGVEYEFQLGAAS